MNNLGNTLLALRHERGFKLKDLSVVTSLSIPYLSAIENGKRTPDLNVIGVICSALGIEPYELLFKAAIEEKIAPERRRLVRELVPVLAQMQELAKQLYDNDDEDGESNNDAGPIYPNGAKRQLPSLSTKKEVTFIQKDTRFQEEPESEELKLELEEVS